MKRFFFVSCFIFLFVLALAGSPAEAGPAATIDSRLEALLSGAADAETIPVIVTFRNGADLSRLPAGPRRQRRAELVRALKGRAEAVQGPVRAYLRGRGIERISDLWIINGLAAALTPEVIRDLAARTEVAAIRLDEEIRLPRVQPAAVDGPAETNIELVKAPQLWAQGFTGLGVTVATMDSGVDVGHPDLGPQWRGGNNSWYDPHGEHPFTPFDADGHGTGVMGVLVGGNAGGTFIGVAPEAQWIAVKIFKDDESSTFSVVHQGFGWLLDPDGDPDTDDAPDVINNSWSFDDPPGACNTVMEFQSDMQAMKAAGIAVVFAAGNTGPGANTSVTPANYPGSLSVGSVGTQQSPTTVSNFSARGPSACDGAVYPDLVGPGFSIRTANPVAGGFSPDSYVRISGTSFAAPHAAGVMALLTGAFPGRTADELEAALMQSAGDLGTAGPDNNYGYGLVDALAAFNLLNASAGIPKLAVSDPVPPPNDLLVDFGSVPPGQSADLILTLSNAGEGLLYVLGFGVSQSPFSIAADNCTGRNLEAGASCVFTLRFAPQIHAVFSGSVVINTNDPDKSGGTVALAGAGNTPPPPPQLAAPADGAAGLETTVVLEWRQLPDADGDGITSLVFISTSGDFTEATPIMVAASAAPGAYLPAGGAFLMVFAVAAGLRKRKWRAAGLLAVAGLLLLSCGGGGSGSAPAGAQNSRAVSDLTPATTYFWKVAALDGMGGRTESAVRSFTTR